MEYLNNYIYGENLTNDQLRAVFRFPLDTFAYRIAHCKNYSTIKGRLALLQMSTRKGAYYREVSYILDHTNLTRRQKLWLKFQYVFL